MGSVGDTDRVLIIGAGAAGLLIAQVLKKNGIPCTVFEQDVTPHARPRDWNYGIYWAQSSLSECLPQALIDQLQTVQVDSHTPTEKDVLPAYNGKSGEKITDIPAPFSFRLKRRKFLKMIATGIDIKWGKRLQEVDSDGTTVTVKFEDGTQEGGRLVIGAEGAHSRVREYLVGKEKAALSPSPCVSSIATPRLPAEVAVAVRKLHPRYCSVFHPDGYFLWVGIHDETGEAGEQEFLTMISWVANEPTGLSGDAILDDLKERASHFVEPFNSVFQTMSSGERIWHSRLSYWITEPWDNRNGTTTLAGDAAHPMTFHRGQGLNNAILDAASLGREIAKLENKSPSSIRHALTAYEKDVWERGKEAVISQNLNSVAIHNWEQLQESPLFKMGLKKPEVTERSLL